MINKKLIVLLLSFLLVPSGFMLAQFPADTLDIPSAITTIQNYIWMIFAGFSVIMFIWAGIQFLAAQGDPSKVTQSRQFVLWGVVGVGVALISNSVLEIVKGLLGV